MSDNYWDPQLETFPVERRRTLRDHRLRWQVRRCWDGSPFYRARLESAGLDAATFGGLADLHRIPILRPDDLPPPDPNSDPSPEWTVAPEEWWQEHEPGDNGLVRVLTDGDITQRAHQAARAAWATGTRPGRSLAAMAGARRAGTTLGIANVSPAVAYSCDGTGLHWSDDHFLVELVNPVTARSVESGERGALLITDLSREGSPLVRFWTGLVADLFEEPCPCGRTSARSTVIRPLADG
jgi:phenylacetate-coenzyme A ligase PaaK-like adenylate-forming protein